MSVRLLTFSLAGLLLVGGLGRAGDKLVQRVYPVADLVVPLDTPEPAPSKPKTENSMPACTPVCGVKHSASPTLADRLIKLIVQTIAPTTWHSNGGQAQIEYFPVGMSLVVHQSAAVQEQVADLLAALRRNQDMQVAVEVRLITIPEGFRDPIASELAKQETQTVFLKDAQLAQFMQAMQGDQRTNCMQAPKLTVANGQCATVEVTEQQYFVTRVSAVQTPDNVVMCPVNEAIPTGVKLTVQPAISGDRRFVRLHVKADLTELASAAVPLFPVTTYVKPVAEDGKKGNPVPFTQFIQQPHVNKSAVGVTVSVPDGGTILIGGLKRVHEARCESGTPVLSNIPYVNRLFKNVGYSRETDQVVVLVTPRIIVSEEEEARQPAPVPPKCAAVTCPYLKEQQANQSAKAAPVPTATVMENLTKLEQAQKLYRQGDYYRLAGKLETARFYYERVHTLCPGSSYDKMADQQLSAMQGSPEGDQTLYDIWNGAGQAEALTRSDDPVARLVWQYDQACAEGRTAEAAQFAIRALAVDPTCFTSRSAMKKKEPFLMHLPLYFPLAN